MISGGALNLLPPQHETAVLVWPVVQGGVLKIQGRYEQAEDMYRQALELWERALGKEHPETLTSIGNLASVLRDQGKYE